MIKLTNQRNLAYFYEKNNLHERIYVNMTTNEIIFSKLKINLAE